MVSRDTSTFGAQYRLARIGLMSEISVGGKRHAAAALLQIVADFVLFQLFLWVWLNVVSAHVGSFVVATALSYFLIAQSTFVRTGGSPKSRARQKMRYVIVRLMAFFFRAGVLSVAVDIWQSPAEISILFAIVSGAVVSFLGDLFYVSAESDISTSWQTCAVGVVLYALALRLVFLGTLYLLPEEAYYWNYAQHLDIGYLDHPPMVAWLIWAGTHLFRDTELGVRIGAYAAWFVTAGFAFGLALNLYGRAAAFMTVLLCATLPFFFAVGLIMTPDAPLTAAWAGTLYFLERALLGERRAAWVGAGICIGLGLLSKYTIALVALATLVFVLVDPRSRIWLRRPWPYAAAAVSALLFSPVIVWNARNQWASFLFQGPQRIRGPARFGLGHLIGSMLLLLTPVALAAIGGSLVEKAKGLLRDSASLRDRRKLFVATFTLVPLSIFFAFSLFHEAKLNWTGPLWLAILPTVASAITARTQQAAERPSVLRRAWHPTIVTVLILYGVTLHYLTLGLPGVGYSSNLSALPVAWREFGRLAAIIEQEVESVTGEEPLRVGLDKYFLSSQMAFYDPIDNDGAANTAGRGLFGRDSLMYDRWFPAHLQRGRTVILFSLNAEDLSGAQVASQFAYLDAVREQAVFKRSVRVGQFYYRVGYDYRTN